VVTPNGDGINDELRISYELYGLPQGVPVQIEVFSLDGRRVAQVAQGIQGSGPQVLSWDGRDERGAALAPGMYLLGIGIQAEKQSDLQIRPIGVVY
jgi:flagellar hook assembly protein FlgD